MLIPCLVYSSVQFSVKYGVHCTVQCTIEHTVHCNVKFMTQMRKDVSFPYITSQFNQHLGCICLYLCLCTVYCKEPHTLGCIVQCTVKYAVHWWGGREGRFSKRIGESLWHLCIVRLTVQCTVQFTVLFE